jgi:hypothetical protein
MFAKPGPMPGEPLREKERSIMRSLFRIFARAVKQNARHPLRVKLKLEALEDRTLPSSDVVVGSIMASPTQSKGVIDLNGANLLSVPWDGHIGTDFLIPHSFGEVAAGSQGDVFFVGPYQGQDGVFKIDHATKVVSRVMDTQYDRIALGPGDAVVGLLIPRVEFFPLSYAIQRNGQTVLTLIPKDRNPDPNAADNSINDVAIDGIGDIDFTGTYQGQDGVFKVDHTTNNVSRVLNTSYQRIALGPNGDIVGSGISQAPDHYNAYIDVNGIRNVTLDNTVYPVVPSAVAVGANQSLYFTGAYGGQTGVFRIDHYRNKSLGPAGSAVTLVVTRVLPTPYDNIAVESAASNLTGNAAIVQSLFVQFLHRAGDMTNAQDAGGWVSLLDHGAPLSTVANGVIRSQEALGWQVEGLYQRLLGRDAVANEQAAWAFQIQHGQTLESVTKQILDSPEYQNRFSSDADFVQALYRELLHRNGSDAEVAGWRSALPTSGRAGVVQGFVTSLEFRMDEIGEDYTQLLHRSPSAAEVAAWLAAGIDALSMNVLFATSPEFQTNG